MTPSRAFPDTFPAAIKALVEAHGLGGFQKASPLRRDALACVALPTCALAMAEAERYLPDCVSLLEACLAAHGLERDTLHLRITGCPNGCARPYLAEMVLVGKAPGRYNLFLGGDVKGQRLNRLYRENIDEAGLLEALEPLLAAARRAYLVAPIKIAHTCSCLQASTTPW
ncbi:sulfite reductase subunit beta [Melittangium boletus DSM 14713]|uniref:Sulfite reductase subunit beta n=1 Tax=Melittangium boletus DSM 14713 TaxID=1294270 RepID=A0A250IMC8_9BACT|nr:sulfite reductase subunit beta [Melittangium boletus DSM 14713]